jgi:hypothetical protein
MPVSGSTVSDIDRAVPIGEVAETEKKEIAARRLKFGIGHQSEQDQTLGLALSGGGIRSATFNLGVLQQLAEEGLLKHVDYLSTVSGGGYIGSWLCSWIRREQQKTKIEQPEPVELEDGKTHTPEEVGFERVRCSLSVKEPLHTFEKAKVTQNKSDPKTQESPKITFLRQYSNYLTPRLSIFSADTWVVGAVWARNTLLNLAFLVALCGAVILIVRGLGLLLWSTLFAIPANQANWIGGLVVSASLLLPMVELIARNVRKNSNISAADAPSAKIAPNETAPPIMPESLKRFLKRLEWFPPKTSKAQTDDPRPRNDEQEERVIALYCFSPLLSAIAYSFWLARARHMFIEEGFLLGVAQNWLALLGGFIVIQICALQRKVNDGNKAERAERALAILFPFVAAFVTAALLRGVAFVFDALSSNPQQSWLVLTLGPPMVLLAFTIGIVVHIGLMGRDLPESCREWLGRLGAWLTIFQAAWIVVAGIAIYGPWLVGLLWEKSHVAVATMGTGWIASTVGGLFAGTSNKTSGKTQSGGKRPNQALEVVAKTGPYIFMLGFFLAVALGTHALLVHALDVKSSLEKAGRYSQVENNQVLSLNAQKELSNDGSTEFYRWYWWQLGATQWWIGDKSDRWYLSGLAPLLILLLAAEVLLAWRIDINLFSMHNFYRNRLVRCYLGASRQRERTPSPFTGFDELDDTALDRFTNEAGYCGPYPIVNATLNVTSGGKLQYQERQAESFIFTPHYTGFSADTMVNEMRLGDAPGKALANYEEGAPAANGQTQAIPAAPNTTRRAVAYRPTSAAGGGISLGMAMAISGAAVSPNMGYHTSTAVSFLLSVFNVRLGWWLGNGLKDSTFGYAGPRFGLRYLLLELFGLSNANSSCVNLSDGGHFDNMGIYELVRRRCRYIICCDAEQDDQLRFDGIANAIRKCRTDFAVDIDLPLQRLAKRVGFSSTHCVVGRIQYPDSTEDGYLLYLKASLTGDEAADVLNYRAEAPEFPHQPTADQWFDESQFESYRKLGHHIARKALCGKKIDAGAKKFFESLYEIWYPASSDADKHSTAHTDLYSAIFEAIRRDESLEDLDKDLFAGFKDHPLGAAQLGWGHSSGHACNNLIHLMQRVFYDLRLEDRDNLEDPYIKGWENIFKYWVQTDSFKKTWAVTESSYPNRFRAFYNGLAVKHKQANA